MARESAMDEALWMLDHGHLSIDEEGHIWRHSVRRGNVWRPVIPRRAESPGGNGYLRINLQVGDRVRGVSAHRLIWTRTHGPIPDGLQINHLDLDKHNNHVENLELVTASGNIVHSYDHGRTQPWTHARTWRAGRDVLTEERKDAIRAARASGRLLRDIAEEFDLSVSHVHRICS